MRDKFTRASVPTGAWPDSRQSARRPFLHSLLPRRLLRFLSFPMGLRNRSKRPTLQSEKGTKDGIRRERAERVRGPGTGPRGAGASGRLPMASASLAAWEDRAHRRQAAPELLRVNGRAGSQRRLLAGSGCRPQTTLRRAGQATAGGEASQPAQSPRACNPRAPGPPPPAPAQSPPPRRRALPAASVEAF